VQALPILESSQVAEARRSATQLAAALGFDATAVGRVAIVATELATNLLKHGGGGEILLSHYEADTEPAVELIGLDRGRGIANLPACLRDGYSSTGTAGGGLGAIRRQSDVMEVATWPDLGTAILARVARQQGSLTLQATAHWHGAVSVPLAGEQVCGDSCLALDTTAGRTLLMVDGLGHGPEAATAANEAVRLLQRHATVQVPQLLELLHAGLRHTRGAAVAIARFDAGARKVIYGGIGNIAGALVDREGMRRMVSLNGTAGLNARKFQAFDYPAAPLVILNTDGLMTHWSLNRYPGIHDAHPTLIAAVLYRDFARRRDDATVLVMRCMDAAGGGE
jgi:anti-sigma regulatory factor (Ser/Thr protein kinase)